MSVDLVGVGGKLRMYKGATENMQDYFPNILELFSHISVSVGETKGVF